MRKLDLPSSSIVRAVKCAVEPDHGAVRRYARGAVERCLFGCRRAGCNTLEGVPPLGVAAQLPKTYEYIVLKHQLGLDRLPAGIWVVTGHRRGERIAMKRLGA